MAQNEIMLNTILDVLKESDVEILIDSCLSDMNTKGEMLISKEESSDVMEIKKLVEAFTYIRMPDGSSINYNNNSVSVQKINCFLNKHKSKKYFMMYDVHKICKHGMTNLRFYTESEIKKYVPHNIDIDVICFHKNHDELPFITYPSGFKKCSGVALPALCKYCPNIYFVHPELLLFGQHFSKYVS